MTQIKIKMALLRLWLAIKA